MVLTSALDDLSRPGNNALHRRDAAGDSTMASIAEFEDHCWKDVVPAADMALYSRYARETFIGPRAALVAIDLYNVVYRGGEKSPHELDKEFPSTCGINAHRAIEPTKRLFAAARRAGLPIFYCTGDDRANSRPTRAGEAAVATKRQGRVSKPDDNQIFSAFTPQPEDVVIPKQRASIFQGTPLVSHLTLLGIQSIIMCGESTSGCVRASAVDAFSTGYHVTLVEECCFDRVELSHKVNLFDLHHKYVDVMHIDEVEAHLAGAGLARAAE
jgi:maleamate amidohydrolase